MSMSILLPSGVSNQNFLGSIIHPVSSYFFKLQNWAGLFKSWLMLTQD